MDIHGLPWLTNAFSKWIEKHALSVALHGMRYNLADIHKMLRISPAMAAGKKISFGRLQTLWP